MLIDVALLDRFGRHQTLAPLHQPNNLASIRLATELDPDAYRREHPAHTDGYAMPRSFYEELS